MFRRRYGANLYYQTVNPRHHMLHLSRTSPNEFEPSFIKRVDEFAQAATLNFYQLPTEMDFQFLVFAGLTAQPAGKTAVGKCVRLLLSEERMLRINPEIDRRLDGFMQANTKLTDYYTNLVKQNPDRAIRAFMLTKMFRHEAELRVVIFEVIAAVGTAVHPVTILHGGYSSSEVTANVRGRVNAYWPIGVRVVNAFWMPCDCQ